jgi:dCTP deaminase
VIDLVAAFEGRPPGAVLIDEEIRRLADEAKLISDFAEDSLQPASYDLRLGSEYFLGGARQRLSSEQRSCALASGEFMLVTSREELTLPLDVVARAGLISHWAQKGLISLLSTQIDPGFVGIMIVPILNAGHAPVTLEYCEPIITVEFMRTTVPVKTGWVNLPGNMPQRRIPDSTELRMASPGLTPVTERLDELETSVRQMRAWHEGYFQGKGEKQGASGVKWAVISGVVAILALIVALVLALIDVI